MTREITMIKKSIWNYDMYSSLSLEIIMPNRSFFRKIFENIKWDEMFEVGYEVTLGENRRA